MRFRARKAFRFGSLRLNFTQSGFSSWSIHVGPWSWNSRTRGHTLDTPGPGALHWGGRGRSRR